MYLCMVNGQHSTGIWLKPTTSYWCCGKCNSRLIVTQDADRIAKIVGGVLTGLLAVACGWMGENHHIGFTVSSRFSWGMRGSYFPVVLRVFVACIWFGLQAYWEDKRPEFYGVL